MYVLKFKLLITDLLWYSWENKLERCKSGLTENYESIQESEIIRLELELND